MNKFFILLKKEIKELLTVEMILPLVIVMIFFMFIGNIIEKEQNKAKITKQEILLIDNDRTNTSKLIKDMVSQSLIFEENQDSSIDNAISKAKSTNKPLILVIPEGFEKSIINLTPEQIEMYSLIKNFSFIGTKNYQVITASLATINDALSNQLIQNNTPLDPDKLKKPMTIKDFVIIGDKKAETNPMEVMNYVSTQTTYIPIILFLVIVMASQMIATAIASEKENKTLETLLTTPVKRTYIVVSKMTAAGLVALISTAIYMFGFRNYANGMSGEELDNTANNASGAISQLGITFTSSNYLLLGVSLFFGILVALSISIILGAFAQDVKSVAGLTSPLMVLVFIPYLLTLMLDINSLSPTLKYIVYAIPFSHSFLAAPNLLIGNYMSIVWGALYQAIFFVIFVLIATKIFSTDKIITMRINFGKKN